MTLHPALLTMGYVGYLFDCYFCVAGDAVVLQGPLMENKCFTDYNHDVVVTYGLW